MAGFLALAVASALVHALWRGGWLEGSGSAALTASRRAGTAILSCWTWLGKRRWVASFGLPLGLLIPVGGIWLALLLGLLSSLGAILLDLPAVLDGTGEDGLRDGRLTLFALAGLTATLGAVVALPITLIRVRLSAETLFNEKITEAASGLYAQRQVTRRYADGRLRDEFEDDVVRRNAAIDRLEGLVKERPDTADRVARLLSVYVRELSREFPPSQPPQSADPSTLRDWTRTLTAARSDMENAVKVIGRLSQNSGIPANELPIDLRGANLQGFDLGSSDLQGADLHFTHLHGASLRHVKFKGATLKSAKLQGTNLGSVNFRGCNLQFANLQAAGLAVADLQDADLVLVNLQGSILLETRLQRAVLSNANLKGAQLWQTQLQGANLMGAKLQGSYLYHVDIDDRTSHSGAVFDGAAVRCVNLQHFRLGYHDLPKLFGDGSVILEGGLKPTRFHPEGWVVDELESQEFNVAWRAWQRERGWEDLIPEEE